MWLENLPALALLYPWHCAIHVSDQTSSRSSMAFLELPCIVCLMSLASLHALWLSINVKLGAVILHAAVVHQEASKEENRAKPIVGLPGLRTCADPKASVLCQYSPWQGVRHTSCVVCQLRHQRFQTWPLLFTSVDRRGFESNPAGWDLSSGLATCRWTGRNITPVSRAVFKLTSKRQSRRAATLDWLEQAAARNEPDLLVLKQGKGAELVVLVKFVREARDGRNPYATGECSPSGACRSARFAAPL